MMQYDVNISVQPLANYNQGWNEHKEETSNYIGLTHKPGDNNMNILR